jgi:hypothetical protein
MTKDEATAVLKMTAENLVHFDLVDSALLPNLRAQRDDSLARIAKAEADLAGALAAKDAETAKQIDEKDAACAAALAAKDAELAEMRACVEAVLTLPEARAVATDRRRAELLKIKAEHEAQAAAAAAELATV